MLVDSHCHLDRIDLSQYDGSFENAIADANNHGVGHFLCFAIDHHNQSAVVKLAEDHDCISASAGLHPLSEHLESFDPQILVKAAESENVVAIGETGLDYFYAKETKEQQQKVFRDHIRVARETNLPLIIHTRDARSDTINILKEEGANEVGGVLHCFTESLEMAYEGIELGFYVSFSGIVTFRNADALREVAKSLPLDKILVETDCPYLTPVPHRGKPNVPVYVKNVAEFVAELRGIRLEELAEQTTDNFRKLFNKAKL